MNKPLASILSSGAGLALAGALAWGLHGCGIEDSRLAKQDVKDLASEGHHHGGPDAEMGTIPPETTSAGATTATPPSDATGGSPAGQISPDVTASSDITVEITENGFNGQPSGVEIRIKKGSHVRMKFVNKDPTGDNTHIIGFAGLDLPQLELSGATPSATVEFDAKSTGRFGFSCHNQWCTIHQKLQRGKIVVE